MFFEQTRALIKSPSKAMKYRLSFLSKEENNQYVQIQSINYLNGYRIAKTGGFETYSKPE